MKLTLMLSTFGEIYAEISSLSAQDFIKCSKKIRGSTTDISNDVFQILFFIFTLS